MCARNIVIVALGCAQTISYGRDPFSMRPALPSPSATGSDVPMYRVCVQFVFSL